MFRLCGLCSILIGSVLFYGCSSNKEVPGVAPFQGKWHGKTAGGKTIEASFERDHITIVVDPEGKPQKKVQGVFRVIEPGDAGAIEVVETQGKKTGSARLGLFAFEGARLKLCLADFDKDRPASLAAAAGVTYVELDKDK